MGTAKKETTGICYLAGAGPGDIGLVTLRVREELEMAVRAFAEVKREM